MINFFSLVTAYSDITYSFYQKYIQVSMHTGTSLSEDKSIDKADIYSTQETGTRHLDRAQEKPVEKVEDKNKGSWRIKEEREEN